MVEFKYQNPRGNAGHVRFECRSLQNSSVLYIILNGSFICGIDYLLKILSDYIEFGGYWSDYSEAKMKTARTTSELVGPSLARIRVSRKQFVPLSADLSRCALEFQIELRALLLKDVELVRCCLRGPNGVGSRYCGHPRRHRRFGYSSLHRTKPALPWPWVMSDGKNRSAIPDG